MISVKMFSGEILIFNQSCHYEFINNKLEVLFPNYKIYNDASIGKTLEGNRFPTFNKTIFYKNDGFVSSVGYSEFSPNMLINYDIDKSCKIKKIKFSLKELDCFYVNEATQLINKIESEYANSLITSQMISDFNRENIKRESIIIDNCIIDYSFELNYLYRFSSLQSVEKEVYLSFFYDFDDNYELIYKLILYVQKLFSFLTYRNNISLEKIIIETQNDKSQYFNVGLINYYSNYNFVSPSDNYIKSNIVLYDYYKSCFNTLFQYIIDERIGLRNIPHSQIAINVYSPERIIMITSSFEREFKLVFNDVITHNPSSLKQKEKIKLLMEDIISNNNLNSDERSRIQKMIKSLEFENFSSKVNEVLIKKTFIEDIIKELFLIYGKKYYKPSFCKVLQNLRNSIAHYNLEIEPSEGKVISIMGLELIVLVLQLLDCGMGENDITFIVRKYILSR